MRRFIVLALILLSPAVCSAASVETFISPDCSFSAAYDFIGGAEDSLHISSYTISSPELVELIKEKKAGGVAVEVLVEQAPAGGMSDRELYSLCDLSSAGIPVFLYDGDLRYMHAKYIIRDSKSSLVTSENLGPQGFHPDADYGNRGWGTIVHDSRISESLLETFGDDRDVSMAVSCGTEEFNLTPEAIPGAYGPVMERKTFTGQKVSLLYSPDSLEEILDLIGSAEDYILVEQFYIYTHWGSPSGDTIESEPSPLVEALLDRAEEGVEIRVLLDSSYYNMDTNRSVSNYNTIAYLNGASLEGLPIEAAAIDLREKGLLKVHNKGMVIDGEKVLVSSINWNENSVRNNRELGLIIEGDAAGYFAAAFSRDWQGADRIYPNGTSTKVSPGVWGETALDASGFWPAMLSLAALISVIIYFRRKKN